MVKRGSVVVWLMVLSLAAVPAEAQEPRAGVLLAYPASFGVQINLGDAVSIRPEAGFSFASNELPLASGGVSTVDSSAFDLGVSAQIYLSRSNGVRPYVSPQLTYHRQTLDSDSPFTTGGEVSSSGYGIAGLFGVLYQASPRLSIFGETGVAYQSTTSDVLSGEGEGSRFANRSSVGVIFWF